jgi:hypothetical protein
MNLMRRVRGVVGTMGVWAVVFGAAGVAGLIPLSFLGFQFPQSFRFVANVFVRWGLAGAGTGCLFATALLLGERRRTLAALSPRRFTAWGFLAGAIVPMGIAIICEMTGRSSVAINLRAGIVFAGICGAAGAALAAATLRAARRAPVSLDDEDPRPARSPISSGIPMG